MKIAIASDFHLGYERFRKDAFEQCQAALSEAAEAADAIVIPGDIFDMRAPKPDVIAEAINIFRNLSKRQWKAAVVEASAANKAYTSVPVLAIPGTHERRARGAENAVTLLGLAGLLVDVSDGYAVIEKGGERVMVYGIGGIAEERFRDVLKSLSPKPKEGCFSIFVFHQSVHELLPFSDDFVYTDELPKGFDLYVDGHIHNRVETESHGKHLLIPGSTVLTQLKAMEQEPKGFFVFDTKSGKYEFHRIKSRRFVVVHADANGKSADELESAIREAIDTALSGGGVPVVRVEVGGKAGGGARNIDVDYNRVVKAYEGRAVVDIVKPGIEGVEHDSDADALRKGELESMPVKDYGLGLFLKKLKVSKYNLPISASQLFDLLSADTSKDKAVKTALEKLLAE